MANTKDNRRAKMTDVLIKNSLIELMKDKPLRSVSVRAICENADINRSTFYAHYADQYSLIKALEDELLNEVVAFIDERELRVRQVEAMSRLLTYFENRKDLFLCLRANSTEFSRRLEQTIHDEYISKYKKRGRSLKGSSEYRVEFLAAGTIRLVELWLLKEQRETPEEMAKMILAMFVEEKTAE